jgi:hypothetical protein
MTRPLAYVCVANNENNKIKARCRALYDLGYLPVCPSLMFNRFLEVSCAEEREDARTMSEEVLRRCRLLVAFGDINDDMAREIMLARRLGIITTSFGGLSKIAKAMTEGINEEDERA